MKVALVYDRINKWGGAERTLLALHEIFPNAPLYTSVYDKKNAPWRNFNVKTSFLQSIPWARRNHELLAPLMPYAFESFSFNEYDLVISITSEAAKGIITPDGTKHLCYILTPTRYLWSGHNEYFKNRFTKLLSYPFINVLKKWDLKASKMPDAYISISKEVQKRVKKYYGRKSELVYPPVTLESGIKNHDSRIGEYFLVVSRLSRFTNYKRVDLAIDAANKLRIPLKIIGDGDLNFFKKRAGPTVEFVGKVPDEKLAMYYQNSKALIFCGDEDLGLVMVEAQRFGKPVIAYKKGGALEIVKSGKTGIFFDEQTKESLIKAIEKFNKYKFSSQEIIKNTKKFDSKQFKKNFLSVVNKLI